MSLLKNLKSDAAIAGEGREHADVRVLEERALPRVDLPGFRARYRRNVVRITAIERALQVEKTGRLWDSLDRYLGTQVFCGSVHPGRR